MAAIQVPNETESFVTRTTKDGRTLRYQMKVLQQPQRARACGSGAKSSADRRPVDPPPVVELKIFEGDAKNDITFSHNANFFLYTTLESARAIAPVRGNAIPAPYPVLTGTPVAGMAYLDRPVPAGYFIFPDLSVRHEGKYRLSFNLFEELKEDKDADPNSSLNAEHPNKQLLRSSPMAPQAHVHFRLEVKSEPFIVYSAKKFPGLAESTSLSRVVAEQGCRVRIRRDVRMRRRENKPSNKEYDDYEDDNANYPRQERFATPDAYSQAAIERARSVSNTSVDGNTHQYPAVDRRTTSHDGVFAYPPAYQQAAISTPLPQQTNNFGPHLSFGTTASYQAPSMTANGVQPLQPFSVNPSFGFQQQQPQHPHTAGHSRHGSNASIVEYAQPYQPQSQFPTQQPYPDRSTAQPTSQLARDTNNYIAIDNKFMPTNPQYFAQTVSVDPRSGTPTNTSQLLPPLKTIQPAMPASIVASPATNYDPASSAYDFSPSQVAAKSAANGKRSFSTTFDSSHNNGSLTQGARPDASGQDILQIDTEEDGLIDEDQLAQLKMLSYRRADGSRQHKKIPSPVF